ncbi:AzlC family ABC transporter permease [Fervidibacillus halotolerans]|uniref:AzlC family ABC transporter permease n=1 Tax=Fervidibacillus halotolerans TaxID=2980027 RepID=A0A9E8M0P6_9BACI|nr:AzlC family ABC transporter permease [Fervidibacillus halotolerans]WAA13026.1 AzlC family ABC transporter permease [Fervidibacillus halotolerans]
MQVSTVGQIGSSLKTGLQAGVPIAIGYMPIAITYGFIAKATGLSLIETVLMSVIVFAGASQYMALDMITKQSGGFEIIITTLIVNIRHFLMSASLNGKVEKDHPLKKAIYSFGITDETFSVAAVQKGKISTSYMLGLNFISYISWVGFSAVGYIVGAGLPDVFQEGMSIALYAMFIGLLVPSIKGNRKVLYLAVVAAGFNSLFTFYQLMSIGWSIVLSTLLSSVLVEWVCWIRRERIE